MPTPETETIKGHQATLFRDGNNPIYLLPDGRFAVRHAGQWAVRKSLAGCEKIVQQTAPTIKLIFDRTPEEVIDAIAMDERWVIRTDGKKIHVPRYSNERIRVYNKAVVDKLVALDAEHEKAEEKYDDAREDLLQKLIQVRDADKFKELQQKAEGD